MDPVSPSSSASSGLGNNGTLFLANEAWLWPMVAFVLVALAVVIASYRRNPLKSGARFIAITLKTLGLALLALVLLEPMWTGETPKKGANDLIILADNSRGLAIDESVSQSMTDLLSGSEGNLPEWLTEAEETFRLQTYTFDSRLERSVDYSDIDFSGESSALITSLSSLKERYDRRPLAGILVFTDGNATDAGAIREMMSGNQNPNSTSSKIPKAPIFPVAIGRAADSPGKDLSVSGVSVTQSPFEDAPVTIAADVTALGKVDATVILVLDEEGEEVLREPVVFGDTDNRRRVRLQVPSVKPGVSFFKLAVIEAAFAEPLTKGEAFESGELTLENNTRLVSVDRGRGPYRVLYVSGRPNWEYKFLRRSIQLDPELDLVALIRIAKREPKFEWRGRQGEASNPLFRGFNPDIPEETQRYDQPVMIRLNTRDAEELRDGFPKSEEELFDDYRAIIIDDVEAEYFTQEQLNLIERFVAVRGGTVIMLGGQESYQQGGWNNTPVGEMLPVYLDRLSKGAPALEATFNLSREGWLEPWVRLRTKQDDEEIRLVHMPPFFAVNQVQAIKPGASVLASVTDSQRRAHPTVVTQRFGEGRTGSVLVADFWRWGMEDANARDDMEKAWRQMLRWMVVDVPDRVEVTTTEKNEGANPVINFSVRVKDETFRVQDDASVKIEITRASNADGETPKPTIAFGEPSLEEGGLFEANHYPQESGSYRAQIEVRDGEGNLVGEKETGWTLNPLADEFRSLTPNRELLQSIAAESGGRVLELDEVKDFVAELPNLEAPVTETWTRPFWHAPWIFLLALLCFIGEWMIRRWKGGIL